MNINTIKDRVARFFRWLVWLPVPIDETIIKGSIRFEIDGRTTGHKTYNSLEYRDFLIEQALIHNEEKTIEIYIIPNEQPETRLRPYVDRRGVDDIITDRHN